MARTSLTVTTSLGSYGDYSVANAADMTMAAADTSNQNQFTASGNDLIVAHNTGASPYTVTINSVDDRYGRAENIAAYSLGAGEYAVFGPFKKHGWGQTDKMIYLEASNADVKFGVVKIQA